MEKNIWLISGISSGLGKALAELVIDKGEFVIGTFRQEEQVAAFNAHFRDKGFGIKIDLSNPSEIAAGVEQIYRRFGRIDVLVNNAGYGMAGAIEESSMEEVRDLFEANFFGALQLCQLVLPGMRRMRRGHMIQISSHGGFKAFAGFGIYNASKFALEGLSEALAEELAPLGIRLTIVEPGPFRTRFAGRGFVLAQNQLADYQPTAGIFREKIKSVDGKQEGDPQKAAEAIYQLSQMETPPLRLPLGGVALATIKGKLEQVAKDVEAMRSLAEGAVFEENPEATQTAK